MAKIMPDYDKLIVCTSASKCFNMAGLMFAEILIRDETLKEWYIAYTNSYAMNVNPLAIAAHQAAYEKGGEWLDQMKTYLDGNFAFVKETLDRELPETHFVDNAQGYIRLNLAMPRTLIAEGMKRIIKAIKERI